MKFQVVWRSQVGMASHLLNFKMVEITVSLLDRFMADHKEEAIKLKSKRLSFKDDLKCLKALLNWYRENYDALFVCPILKRHNHAVVIQKSPVKNKTMKAFELIEFFKELPPFWRDFASMNDRLKEIMVRRLALAKSGDTKPDQKIILVWSLL